MTRPSKTEKNPLISVVMPAYNAGPYIGEVIATILGQTFDDFELIIIDDGSSDNTPDVIKKYASIDSRIKYHHQKNQGSEKLGSTINKAISFARADWIARADADDPWYLDKLEKQIAFINSHPGCILLGGVADITNERGVFLYPLLGPLDDDDNRRSLTLYTTFAHGSVLFKRSVFKKLGGYRDIHAAEDLDLWQRMSLHGEVYNLPEPLFKYRQNSSGISMSNQLHQSKMIENLGIEFFKNHTPKSLTRAEFKKKLNAINSLRGGDVLSDHLVDWLIVRLVEDNVRICRLFIKYGDKRDGYKQLLAIASSGRVGCKTALRAIKSNLAFQVTRLWKKS